MRVWRMGGLRLRQWLALPRCGACRLYRDSGRLNRGSGRLTRGGARSVGIAVGVFAEAGDLGAAACRADRPTGPEAAENGATQSSLGHISTHVRNPPDPNLLAVTT